MVCGNASLYADDTVIYFYSSSSQELSDNLDLDLLAVAKWLNNHKLTLNLEKTKCMLVGSNSIVIVLIFDHNVNNVNSFKYLGIVISSDFTWTNHVEYIAGKTNQRLGLLNRIKHLLPFSALLLFYNSLVVPLFDSADLVWGDKHNVTLMTSLQVLQTKAAKIILDRPLYSSATHALALHKSVPLEKGHFQRRCSYVYKCLNGLVEHDMNFIRQQEQHDYNTRTKLNLRLPSAKRNWGKQRTAFHAIKDFNSFSQAIRQSVNLNIFKRNLIKFVISMNVS